MVKFEALHFSFEEVEEIIKPFGFSNVRVDYDKGVISTLMNGIYNTEPKKAFIKYINENYNIQDPRIITSDGDQDSFEVLVLPGSKKSRWGIMRYDENE